MQQIENYIFGTTEEAVKGQWSNREQPIQATDLPTLPI